MQLHRNHSSRNKIKKFSKVGIWNSEHIFLHLHIFKHQELIFKVRYIQSVALFLHTTAVRLFLVLSERGIIKGTRGVGSGKVSEAQCVGPPSLFGPTCSIYFCSACNGYTKQRRSRRLCDWKKKSCIFNSELKVFYCYVPLVQEM